MRENRTMDSPVVPTDPIEPRGSLPANDLLTPRDAEYFTGTPYGMFTQWRRSLTYWLAEGDEATVARYRAFCPPWVKVGRRIMYRREDLLPFMTNRAGANRNGTCGVCRFYKHEAWEVASAYFDPNRAYCTWAAEMPLPEKAPPWMRGALRQRVQAKGGRACEAFTPRKAEPRDE